MEELARCPRKGRPTQMKTITPREYEILQVGEELRGQLANARTPEARREVLRKWNQIFGPDPTRQVIRLPSEQFSRN